MSGSTYTYSTLEVSDFVYNEITRAIAFASHEHRIDSETGAIDMHGIGLVHSPRNSALLSDNLAVDDAQGVLTLFGVRIHADLLRALSEPTPRGLWFRVTKVVDGIATIEARNDLIEPSTNHG